MHDLRFEPAPDAQVAGSQSELLSALSNLVSNAVRYTGSQRCQLLRLGSVIFTCCGLELLLYCIRSGVFAAFAVDAWKGFALQYHARHISIAWAARQWCWRHLKPYRISC